MNKTLSVQLKEAQEENELLKAANNELLQKLEAQDADTHAAAQEAEDLHCQVGDLIDSLETLKREKAEVQNSVDARVSSLLADRLAAVGIQAVVGSPVEETKTESQMDLAELITCANQIINPKERGAFYHEHIAPKLRSK